jgi:hydroxymethylpyrimidine/phosphomethylpyrimidine kinase
VADQFAAAFEANRTGSVKIGLLPDRATIKAVAAALSAYPEVPAVLDPVMAASSGRLLVETTTAAALVELLLPHIFLVTPNWPELARLSESPLATSQKEAIAQGASLLGSGARHVLVKGGHAAEGKGTDIVLRAGHPPIYFRGTALAGKVRGTGCILSSAIAAALAKGLDLEQAIEKGRDAVHQAFRRAGFGPAAPEPPGYAPMTRTGSPASQLRMSSTASGKKTR